MIATKNELLTRKDEVNSLLCFAQYIEGSNSIPTNAGFNLLTVQTGIKANIILMIYNAVEATVTKALKKIHEEIQNSKLTYSELIPEIRKIMALYYGNAISRSNNDMDKAMDYALLFADFLTDSENSFVSFDELAKKYQLYSGNLDTREITRVLKKYGIDYHEKCSELKTIKDDRNLLAHGVNSFEEIGRELSTQQLQVMVTNAFSFLEKMIEEITSFLSDTKYKCTTE